MIRVKTFDATGISPGGVLFAGDLNAIEDAAAALTDFTQIISLSTVLFGDNTIQLFKYGTGEARLTSALRTDGIIRGLGGLYAGAFTSTQRDAIAAGFRPYGLVILNTSNNRLEINLGTDTTPNWQPFGSTLNQGTLAARAAASTINQNSFYFATDDNGGTLYYSNGSAWTKLSKGVTALPVAHQSTHVSGGTDALPWATIHGSGTLAARPAAASTNAGYLYLATDTNGGTLYRSTGSAWVQVALGVTQTPTIPSGVITAAMLATGAAVANIGTGGITTTQIADGTIQTGDLAFDVATQAELNAVAATIPVAPWGNDAHTSGPSAGNNASADGTGPSLTIPAGTFLIFGGIGGGGLNSAAMTTSIGMVVNLNLTNVTLLTTSGTTITSTIHITAGGSGGGVSDAWLAAFRVG